MNNFPCLINFFLDPIGQGNILQTPLFSADFVQGDINPPPPPLDSSLLKQDGYALLNQSGGLILL